MKRIFTAEMTTLLENLSHLGMDGTLYSSNLVFEDGTTRQAVIIEFSCGDK